ncbi:MAG: cytochrome c [Candidatus Lambdaproteobacteria bacterium]|nr:cytochrome c [Candidatus Lambdaproteobacteria bacterium]
MLMKCGTSRGKVRAAIAIVGLIAGIFAGIAYGAGNRPADDEFLPENPEEGSALFTSKLCIRCHSVQGVGGRTGPDLGEVQLGSLSEITAKLWNHFPRMNEAFTIERLVWPTFTNTQTRKLVTFLYYLNFLDKAANAEVGEKLFHEKNCVRCHSVGGRGGTVGPELDSFQERYAIPYITAALWNSGPKMMETMLSEKVQRPAFRERDVVDILAYIRARGFGEEARRRYLAVGNPISGKEIFRKKGCSYCHSVRGNGGKIGPDLARQPLKGSLSYILSELWNHGSNMWPRMKRERIKFPTFKPQEMADLISYLYFLKFRDVVGTASHGADVFARKNCKLCHTPKRPGDETIGPNLAEVGLKSSFDVLAAMWNHAPRIEDRMKEEGIRWPLFEKEEMADLVEYILSLNKER